MFPPVEDLFQEYGIGGDSVADSQVRGGLAHLMLKGSVRKSANLLCHIQLCYRYRSLHSYLKHLPD